MKTTMRVLFPVVLYGMVAISVALAQPRASIDGHVWSGSTPLCALVIANGQSVFSCNPNGPFELTNLPLNANGQIEVQIFASGFAPFKETVTPTGSPLSAFFPQVNMVRVRNGRSFQVTENFVAVDADGMVNVSGTANSEGTPVCGLILANGQKMFSCGDNLGFYSLDVPLDLNGNVTVMAFAGGFQPYRATREINANALPRCIDLSGTWRATQSVTITCRLGGESETDTVRSSGTVIVNQEGCNISFADPRAPDLPRTGTIVGNKVSLSGQFVVGASPAVRFTENVVTMGQTIVNPRDFTLTGEGMANGTLDGSEFRCGGDTTISVQR